MIKIRVAKPLANVNDSQEVKRKTRVYIDSNKILETSKYIYEQHDTVDNIKTRFVETESTLGKLESYYYDNYQYWINWESGYIYDIDVKTVIEVDGETGKLFDCLKVVGQLVTKQCNSQKKLANREIEWFVSYDLDVDAVVDVKL
jgi:hypothetical protein